MKAACNFFFSRILLFAKRLAPYKLMGLLALSVDKATTRLMPLSDTGIDEVHNVDVGFDALEGLYSAVGTILVAAAWCIVNTVQTVKTVFITLHQ